MVTIVTRAGKGSPLTSAELDANFNNLNAGITASGLPAIRPSLLLDFTNGELCDSRVTFSRTSSGSYFDSDKKMKFASENIPRFTCDAATGVCNGLLIEESRTNSILYSEALDNAYWSKSGATVTANTEVAPDGTLTACTVSDTSTALYGVVRTANVVASSGQQVAGHIFIKKDATAAPTRYVIVRLTATGITSHFAEARLDTSTGAFLQRNVGAGVSDYAANVEDYGGFWRVWVSLKITDASLTGYFFEIYPAAGADAAITTLDFTVTGSCVVWGAQFEVNAGFPSSYIKTAGAQVTRAADMASIQDADFSSWYSQTEGTFVAVAKTHCRAGTQDSLARIPFAVSDGTFNESVYFARAASSAELTIGVIDGGVSRVTGMTLATSESTQFSLACAYKKDDVANSYNGLTPVVDNIATLPTVDRLFIGANWVGNSMFWCGSLLSLTYYPRRSSDAELQALSSI